MNIKEYQEKFLREAGEAMAKSMDFDIICDVFAPMGYAVVKIEYGPDKKWVDVFAWADSNCVSEFQEHNGKWLFAQAKDATMFMLRWS